MFSSSVQVLASVKSDSSMTSLNLPYKKDSLGVDSVSQLPFFWRFFPLPVWVAATVWPIQCKRWMLHGCLVYSISECANVPGLLSQKIGGPIKEVIGYLFWNDFVKIQADFGKIAGWRRKPSVLVSFEKLWIWMKDQQRRARREKNVTTLDMQRRSTGGDMVAKVQLQFKENYFGLLGPNTEQWREWHNCSALMMTAVSNKDSRESSFS